MASIDYDVAVVGLGGMGASALAECAARGVRAIGLERFSRAHTLGSSSGKSRIIRQAYYEHADYVPLLLRAYERWGALEARTRTELMTLCGLLMAGCEGSAVISGSLASAQEHGIAIEVLGAADLRKRYPTLLVRDDEIGVFEPTGGFVRPEAAIAAFLASAEADAAVLRFDAQMTGWSADEDRVRISLADGEVVSAYKAIFTLGPWFGDVLAEAGMPLHIQRNVQGWFAPRTAAYALGTFPAFLLDRQGFTAPLYGFPDDGYGVKAAFHGSGATVQPDALDREISLQNDIAPLGRALESWMPQAAGTYLAGKACMYSVTSDEHFVIDRHPAHTNVVLCGGFSGHGFKFASVVGEIAADLAMHGGTALPTGFLGLRREG